METLRAIERKLGNVASVVQVGQVVQQPVHPKIVHWLHYDIVPTYSRALAKGDAIGGFVLKKNEQLNDLVISMSWDNEIKRHALITASKVVGKLDGIGSFNLAMYQRITEYALHAKELHVSTVSDMFGVDPLYLAGPSLAVAWYVMAYRHDDAVKAHEIAIGRFCMFMLSAQGFLSTL